MRMGNAEMPGWKASARLGCLALAGLLQLAPDLAVASAKEAGDGQPERAKLEAALKKNAEDGAALAKIIPLYHRGKQDKKAADAVQRLYTLYLAKKYDKAGFVREEFKAADGFAKGATVERTVRAIEYFKPVRGKTTSRFPVVYEFLVLDEHRKVIRKVFLEIDPMLSRAHGKQVYALDENHIADKRFVYHAHYRFFKGERPRYETLRPLALEILKGNGRVLSSHGRPAARYAKTKDAEPARASKPKPDSQEAGRKREGSGR